MKKFIIFIVLLVVMATASVSAWEPEDLTKFPPGMEDGNWILNLGIGIGGFRYLGLGYSWLPTFRFSFDRNAGLGDQGLPFFFGGIVGYTGYGRRGYITHQLPVGFRVGYHFNWDVENLDTYALATVGSTIHFGRYSNRDWLPYNWFYFGVSVGVRYFVSDGFGFFAEMGYNPLSWLDIGIAFKF